jgi:hypothetical protein
MASKQNPSPRDTAPGTPEEQPQLAKPISPEALSLADLKQNFDDKMDRVADGVHKIASGVETIAEDVKKALTQPPGAGQIAPAQAPRPTPQEDINLQFGRITNFVGVGGNRRGQADVTLQRTANLPTEDQPLWAAIRNRTGAIGFNAYNDFINRVMCAVPGTQEPSEEIPLRQKLRDRRDLLFEPLSGVDSYNLLKAATEAFLLIECGVTVELPKDGATGLPPFNSVTGLPMAITDPVPGEQSRFGAPVTFEDLDIELKQYLGPGGLPYLDRIIGQLKLDKTEVDPFCGGILKNRFSCPLLLELIWSYWHEQGMLVQTLNAISWRYQNRRNPSAGRDPLAHLELDPLRPLNSLLWGYMQDEYRRLTVPRRAYEYDHHYGLLLEGKAAPKLQSADSRSKFLEGFHNLLALCTAFFKEDDDTTMIADAFALLNGLREVHLILAEGAHNQYGDLPWTARVEMLIQKWLLARPEMREFLRGRYMVPYEESWMGAVDTMKTLQGWTDTSVTHFVRLANFGEQILLSIRYGDWIGVIDPQQARNWARSWRPEIQGYIHAYRAVTGVDLTVSGVSVQDQALRYAQPSTLLRQRLTGNGARPLLTATADSTALAFRERRVVRQT